MNVLKLEKKLAVLRALVEGNSIRSISRMLDVHKTTVLKLLVRTGKHCEQVMDKRMRNLCCSEIEADELWCFVKKKQRHLTPEERFNHEIGDQYTFVGFDPATKLMPVCMVGKRDKATTFRFIAELRKRINGRIQLSTDGFKPYLEAVESAFGGDVHYAQIVKLYTAEYAGPGRYSPPSVTGVDIHEISGSPKRSKISTSYVERNNLTFRMHNRRFTRLTNAHSKKLSNLKASVALHAVYYNFCRVHSSIQITPAMAAGITGSIWPIEALLN